MSQEKKHTGEWEINLETQEDARRMARCGAYAGYTYVIFTTLLFGFVMLMGMKQFGKMDAVDMEQVTGMQKGAFMLFARLAVYGLLSWRAHSGNGIIAAPVLLVLIMGEILFGVFAGISAGVVISLLGVILVAVFGYVLYAGVRGNWANRQFRLGHRVAA